MTEFVNAGNMLSLGSKVRGLDMYPYFDFAHYVLTCLSVKKDLSISATTFSRRHPASLWFSCMLSSFAGTLIVNFLMGESLVTPFKNTNSVLLATVAWYAVFYMPFDFGDSVFKMPPIYIVLCILKEIQRTHKIHDGVLHAWKLYPNAWIIIICCGALKGCGSGLMRTFDQLVRGIWAPQANEVLRPTFNTKACYVAAAVFALAKKPGVINIPDELLFLGVVAFFIYFKMANLLLGIIDPFSPFENAFCAVFMGGIWDSIAQAWEESKRKRAESAKMNGETKTEDKKDQ